MADVSGNNVSGTVSVGFFEEDHEGTGTETISEETKEGTENETEDSSESEDISEEGTEDFSVFETVEGDKVINEGEYISETLDVSNDGLSDTQDYTNYFTFLIAVVLGLGAVICWAKGFTE